MMRERDFVQRHPTINEVRILVVRQQIEEAKQRLETIEFARFGLITEWADCIRDFLQADILAEEEKRSFLDLLLGVGKNEDQDNKRRRLLLDLEIVEIGKAQCDPQAYDDEYPLKIVQELLSRFPDVASVYERERRTIFHVAAEHGADRVLEIAATCITSTERMQAVIRLGDANGKTPLALAVLKGRKATIKQLLILDPHQLNESEEELAAKRRSAPNNKHVSVADIILVAVTGGENMIEYDPEIVSILLEGRKHLVTEELFNAVIDCGNVKVFNTLLDLRPASLKSSGCLHYAVERGQVDIVKSIVLRHRELAMVMKAEPGKGADSLKRSVLFYNTEAKNPDPSSRMAIRATILPIWIEDGNIVQIRHLTAETDGMWTSSSKTFANAVFRSRYVSQANSATAFRIRV